MATLRSRKKLDGKVIGGAVAAVAAVVVVAGVAVAGSFVEPEPVPEPVPVVASEPDPEPEPEVPADPAPASDSKPVAEALSVPATSFSMRAGTEGPFELYDMQGNKVEPAIVDAEFLGPFSEGFIVGRWLSDETDDAGLKLPHVGLFDGAGQLTLDLTDTLRSFSVGDQFTVSRSEAMRFADSRLVLPVHYEVERTEPNEEGKLYDSFDRAFVLDAAGKLVFEFEYASETVHYASDWDNFAFHDGVLAAHKAGAFGEVLYDVDGNMLADCEGSQFDSMTPLGFGYYTFGSLGAADPVLDYAGATVLDPAALNGDGVVNAKVSGVQPLAGSVVAISAERESETKGAQPLNVSGLYSIAESRWLVPLEEGLECGEGFDGVFPVSREATDGGWPDVVLMNTAGETVFEPSMAEGFDLKSVRGYEHLHDGYWKVDGVSEPGATAVIYIEDGVYRGCTLLNFCPS